MKFFLLLSLLFSVNVFANQSLFEECEAQRAGFSAIELSDGLYGMNDQESQTGAIIFCGLTNSNINGGNLTRVVTLDYGRCINIKFFEHQVYITCNKNK
jgi:hypothetical protein